LEGLFDPNSQTVKAVLISLSHFFFFVSEQRKKSKQKKENLKGCRWLWLPFDGNSI
jgi:preprotein translocase subunit YajC